MREIYTFYYKLANGLTDQVQFKAVSPDDALNSWYSFILENRLDVVDFDHEAEAIEEEREF
jgi:hypothetical protein